jgi:ferric-dicitrate binding protein FerR (iron transport regulator)
MASTCALAAGFAAVALSGRRNAPPVAAAAADLIEMRVLEGEASRSLDVGVQAIHPGDSVWTQPEGRIETAAVSSTQLKTARGLRVEMGASTRLAMDLREHNPEPWLNLIVGAVRCQVPKLQEGTHFSVHTPDADVIVHGTAFSVDVRAVADSRMQTCVRVEEGVVSVSHDGHAERLTASQSWGCADASAPPSMPIDSAAPPPNRERPSHPPGAVTAPADVSSSALAEQNKLLRLALAAEARGDTEKASDALHLLLERYPESPLAPDAQAALARLVVRSKRP